MCKINDTCYKKNTPEKSIVIVEPVDVKTVAVSLFFRKGAEDFDHNLTEVAGEMKLVQLFIKKCYRYAGMLNSAEGIKKESELI